MTKPQPSCAGKSILDLIWDELMDTYAYIKEWTPIVTDPDRPGWMHQDEAERIGNLRGEALGLATAIAIMTNPYAPNVDAVRKEAARRWTDAA